MAGWKFWQREQPAPEAETAPAIPTISVNDLPQASSSYQPPAVPMWDTGEKFLGGFGYTEILALDYWTLRARSAQLFETNHYGRGLIRTFVTNVINTGLHLEATPEESVLGVDEGALDVWTETVEA